MSAFLTVYPLEPTSDGLINSLRLIAPLGYAPSPAGLFGARLPRGARSLRQ